MVSYSTRVRDEYTILSWWPQYRVPLVPRWLQAAWRGLWNQDCYSD